jgi:5-formyltetrahydrofolate cyclo-ligase
LSERVSALPEITSATSVACYVSTPAEPGTGPLLAALSGRECTVMLPILRSDFDLSWAAYQPGALREARFGISEPTGEALGTEAVRDASVVICPGLAGDERGHRLGRGGGSYDRVLARLPGTVLRVVLLYDDEVLPAVPTDEHDEPVHALVTPHRTLRTSAARSDELPPSHPA